MTNDTLKPFPLLGTDKQIPWFIAQKAYRNYTSSQTLERIAERGGFSESEMDNLYPEWRTSWEGFLVGVRSLSRDLIDGLSLIHGVATEILDEEIEQNLCYTIEAEARAALDLIKEYLK